MANWQKLPQVHNPYSDQAPFFRRKTTRFDQGTQAFDAFCAHSIAFHSTHQIEERRDPTHLFRLHVMMQRGAAENCICDLLFTCRLSDIRITIEGAKCLIGLQWMVVVKNYWNERQLAMPRQDWPVAWRLGGVRMILLIVRSVAKPTMTRDLTHVGEWPACGCTDD